METPEHFKKIASDKVSEIVATEIELRRENYLSQPQMAKILGITNHTTISIIEAGKSSPGLERILQMLAVCGYTLEVVKIKKK